MYACFSTPGRAATVVAACLALGAVAGCGEDGAAHGHLDLAAAPTGEAVARVSHPAGAGTWTRTGFLVVPSGAQQLLVASLPGLDNAALDGVEVLLTAPGGATVRLGDGALGLTGLTEDAVVDATLEQDLDAYVDAVGATLPEGFGEADLYALVEGGAALTPNDALPTPPADLASRIAALHDALTQRSNAVLPSPTPRTPSGGLLVLGPEAGTWRVDVTVAADTGAFEVRALVLPDGFGPPAVDRLVTALSGPVAVTAAAAEADPTGADPGCDDTIKRWRYPPAGDPDVERASLLRAGWTVFDTIVIAGGAAAATAILVSFVPEETLAVLAAVFLLSAETFVEIVAVTVSAIFQAATDFDNVAEDLYWRFAWALWTPEQFGTVCYLPFAKGAAEPPYALSEGESVAPEVRVLNGIHWELRYESWGYGVFGNPQALRWQSDVDGVVDLAPVASLHGARCVMKAEESPSATAAVVTVAMPTQPARRDLDVAIAEHACAFPDHQVVVQGKEATLVVALTPPAPTTWAVEYTWSAAQSVQVGTLTSSEGAAAPFTGDAPLARFTAGDTAGVALVSVKAERVATDGGRTLICDAVGSVEVAPDLGLTPDAVSVSVGQTVRFTCTGCAPNPSVDIHRYRWQTGASAGALVNPVGGALVAGFESDDAVAVDYRVSADALPSTVDWVSVTLVEADSSQGLHTVGGGRSRVDVRGGIPPCEVTLGVWEAPAEGWSPSDGTPLDVECELGPGKNVLDPDSFGGCWYTRTCEGQCLGWGDPTPGGFSFSWDTFDSEGEHTGGNYCGGPVWVASTCEDHIAWNQAVCATNRDPKDGGRISACNCACGGGNCYPWSGPGKIVFRAYWNKPCTDTAACYYHHEPSRTEGTISFELVHCGWVDNGLPNCPGNIPE